MLTGPQALTQVEQAHTIGEAIGRPLRYEEISPETARQELLAKGWPATFADAALNYWAKLVTEPEAVTRTVDEVTGAPARTFRQWAIDHAGDLRDKRVNETIQQQAAVEMPEFAPASAKLDPAESVRSRRDPGHADTSRTICRAEPHHVLPKSGWVSYHIRDASDLASVVVLFRLSYERPWSGDRS